MNSLLDTTLSDVAEDTFASLAFLMPLCDEERQLFDMDEEYEAARVSARVEFSGPFAGCIVLGVDAGLLQPLAANMLGLIGDGSTSVEQQYDALKELSNVVCGNLLPKIATPKDVFKVHSPEILVETTGVTTIEGRSPEARVSLWVEGGRANLALFMNLPIATAAT